MASKKKWKKRAKQQERIADELFVQVGMLAGQLNEVDQLLVNVELPGPTIDAWAQQVRDLLSSLVNARGIVSGGIHQAFTLQRVQPPSGSFTEAPDNGAYTMLTDADIAAGR